MSDLRARLRIDGDASGAKAEARALAEELRQTGQSGRAAGGGLGETDTAAGGLARSSGMARGAQARLNAELASAAERADQAARGLGEAAHQAGEFERRASGASQSAALFGAAVTAGAALGGRALVDMTGRWSDLDSRVNITSDHLDYSGDAMDRISSIARRTYSGLELTAEGWLLNANALDEWGFSAQTGLDYTESLNNALVVSAARGQRAETVINAMSRAMALGELRGTELNAVIMTGGRVAQALADGLGVTTNELRELGQDGFLTTERVVTALTSQLEVLRAEANSMPATIADGWQLIGNASLRLTGRIDQLTEASTSVADAMVKVSDAMNGAVDDPLALAEAIETVWTAAQLVGGTALIRWLAGVAVETRASAAAWVMKGQAAETAARNAALGATQEAAAVTSLRGAIQAAAAAELNAARAAVAHTNVRVQAAQAAVFAAQAERTVTLSTEVAAAARARLTQAEAALTAARTTQVAAAGRAAAAEAGIAAASTRSGAAMAGLGAAGRGIVSLFGGPWMLAITAAAGVTWGLYSAFDHSRRMAERNAQAAASWREEAEAQIRTMRALRGAQNELTEEQELAEDFYRQSIEAIAEMTGEVEALADAHLRAAAAKKAEQMAEAQLQLTTDRARLTGAERDYNRQRGAALMMLTGGGARMPTRTDEQDAESMAQQTEAWRTLQGLREDYARLQRELAELMNTPLGEIETGEDAGEIDRRNQRIRDTAEALTLEAASLNARTAAAARGEQALIAWQIAEAGRQAVSKAGLEQDDQAAASIRAQAEAVERLRIETERVATGWEMARQADRDIEALERRTEAMAQGRDALDALRIEEAGIAALRRIGIDTLDGLTTRERDAAEAARDTARAREEQAIAAERAQAALAGIEQLDESIAAEERRRAAVLGGALALEAYARAEFIRQEVERRGLELTDEAAEGLMRKAAALWDLTAANDAAQAAADWDDDLRLMRLSTRERNLQLRTEELILRLRAEQRDLGDEALEAMARARAEAELWAEDWAAAASEMEDMLRDAFIESGELAFSDLGDALERELRRAIYDAMLAEPISILVNATVDGLSGSLSGLTGKGGGLAGIAGLLGNAGAGYMAGSALGLGTGNTGVDAGLALGGAALGGSSMAGALLSGGGLLKGTAIGGLLGGKLGAGLAAVAGPLGALAGLAIGSLLGGVFDNGKRPQSHAEIIATPGGFQVGRQVTHDKGPDEEVSQLADAITQSLNGAAELFGIDMARIAGLTTTAGYASGDKMMGLGGDGFFGGTYKGAGHINQVVREGTSITQVQSAEELAEAVVRETILRAIAAGATDLSAAEQQFVATAKSLEDAVSVIERSRGFAEAIDLAILQFADPAEWQKQTALAQIEATYKQLKTEAEEMIAAGLVTRDILDRIDELKDVQTAEALERLAPAAQEAASALERIQASQREWLDRMAVSALAPASPLTQRDEAFKAYEAQLALAESGDEEAMRGITRYAERLLSADREATTSAQARADLYALVMQDVTRLSSMSPAVHEDAGFDDVVEAVIALPTAEEIGEAVRKPLEEAAERISQSIAQDRLVWQPGFDQLTGHIINHTVQVQEGTGVALTGFDRLTGHIINHTAQVQEGTGIALTGFQEAIRDFKAADTVTRIDLDLNPLLGRFDTLGAVIARTNNDQLVAQRIDALSGHVQQLHATTQSFANTQVQAFARAAIADDQIIASVTDLKTEQQLSNAMMRQASVSTVQR